VISMNAVEEGSDDFYTYMGIYKRRFVFETMVDCVFVPIII
jgi:hypothetical protein